MDNVSALSLIVLTLNPKYKGHECCYFVRMMSLQPVCSVVTEWWSHGN